MFRRMVALTSGVLVASLMVGLPAPAHANSSTSVYFQYRTISTEYPDIPVRVMPRGGGSYTINWEVRLNGNPVPGVSGTEVGVVQANETEPFDILGAGLADDGTYRMVGKITTVLPEYPDQVGEFDEEFYVDRTGPSWGPPVLSHRTIYPRQVMPNASVPDRTVFTFTGQRCDPGTLEPAGCFEAFSFRVLKNGVHLASFRESGNDFYWTGRTNAGAIVPEGTYDVGLFDEVGNPAAETVPVTVSHKRLVATNWTRTVTAGGSAVDRYVGRCSTLKRPARAAWKGSLGYLSNTRCKTNSPRRTSVSTLHAIFLPKAILYGRIQVDVTGGGSRSKPRSRGVVRILGRNGQWLDERTVTGRVGLHAGAGIVSHMMHKVVFDDRSFGWGFATGYGNRYDVRSFTVRLIVFQLR